ncbi:CASc [Nesidiocoris tenuis]|uniref:CASc n=1 Tax=Nesidiocoris tenuis TaxID=355587 RepID=A0ABN7A8U9_9HEMI|nr:CASc [Nesidiocoris tenuis]
MDCNQEENASSNMVDKCQSIKIKKEVSVSDICSTLDGSSYHSEYSYSEYNSTSVYSHSYDGDDEVFLDSEDVAERRNCARRVPRTRRVSDVIDCLGELPSPVSANKETTHFPFPDINEPLPPSPNPSINKFQSPPVTPSSDLGYYSTGIGTPPSLLHFKYSWSSLASPATEQPPRPIADQMDGKTKHDAKCDDTDAKPTNTFEAIQEYSYKVTVEGNMPVDRDSDEYNMRHRRRGVSVILNHDSFSTETTRKGSEIDVEALTKIYEILGFEVRTYHNRTVDQIITLIKELSKADYSDCDCFCLTVLTHGMDRNILHAADGLYPAEYLWRPFTSENCVTLAGKPKIFFIQACRGTMLDGGTRLIRYHTTETDSSGSSYKIPCMADFLIVHSTVEGYYSWRNPETGTWFIQALCHVILERHETTDLLKMMTIVARKVALDFESFNDLYAERHGQKQVPNIMSTLIRDLYFRPKIGT